MDTNGVDPRSTSGGAVGAGMRIAPPRGYALSGKIMLSAIVVLFTVVLLILFLHLYVRWHIHRLAARRRRRRRSRLVFAAALPGAAASRGLEKAAIESLPVSVHAAEAAGEAEEGVAECAVCLNEFEAGEKVRSLPRCGHRFHIECIDMWFHSHATCPLCRAAVEAMKKPPPTPLPEETVAEAAAAAAPPLPPSVPPPDLCATSSSTSGEQDVRIEVPARSGLEDAGGFKPPEGRISAIRRLLTGDLRLYRPGGAAAELDLEAARPPSPRPPTPGAS